MLLVTDGVSQARFRFCKLTFIANWNKWKQMAAWTVGNILNFMLWKTANNNHMWFYVKVYHRFAWTRCTLGCVSTCRLVLKFGIRLIYTHGWSSCHSFITYGRGGWSVCLFSWDVLDRNRQISNKPFIPSFCFIINTCTCVYRNIKIWKTHTLGCIVY